jgi:hypothetical protein
MPRVIRLSPSVPSVPSDPPVHYRCVVPMCSAFVRHGRPACQEHRHLIPEGKEILLRCSRRGCDGIASVLLGSDTREEAALACLCSDCAGKSFCRLRASSAHHDSP